MASHAIRGACIRRPGRVLPGVVSRSIVTVAGDHLTACLAVADSRRVEQGDVSPLDLAVTKFRERCLSYCAELERHQLRQRTSQGAITVSRGGAYRILEGGDIHVSLSTGPTLENSCCLELEE
jgi:hypothetical protein